MHSGDEREAEALRRRERLAASLRENLKRRKAQQKARAAGGAAANGPAKTANSGE